MKINQLVREMTPPRYTTQEAAKIVGKSVDTLRRWRKAGVVIPSDTAVFGELEVPLYTQEDIYRLHIAAKNVKPGPKKTD